nr:hypothetical protein [Pantoea agglomerans]
MKKLLGFIILGIYVFFVSFGGTFAASVAAAATRQVLDESRMPRFSSEQFGAIAKSSAVYGLCVVWAVVVVSIGTVMLKKFIWPTLKYVGLKIRYFFHGY